jgi:hexulose-6-phosphate isomerase
MMTADYLQRYADRGLYTMQGRLVAPQDGRFQSFPRGQWREEIAHAVTAGLRGIEWIYDLYGEGANPLETPEGRGDLRACLAQYSISVVSICADYFMDCPFVRCSDEERVARLQRLEWLISICPELGIGRIVIPFVDNSRIASPEEQALVVAGLQQVLPLAQAHSIELHLETDMAPQAFRELLDLLEHPLIRVNYDAGNSASLGYAPAEEFAAYGERVGSFHIKDRRLGATTVPLGQGDADFASLREQLIRFDYKGDFVLQVARGVPGEEPEWLREMSELAADWLRGNRLV